MSWVSLMLVTLLCKSGISFAHRIRAKGSSASELAMIALGASDVTVISFGGFWDIAAGELIVREAGGVVMDPNGGDLNVLSGRAIAASTRELAVSLMNLLKN